MTQPIDAAREQLRALEQEEKLAAKLEEARQAAAAQGSDTESKEYRAFIRAEQALAEHRGDMNARLGGGGLAVSGDAQVTGETPETTTDLPPAEPAAAPPQE